MSRLGSYRGEQVVKAFQRAGWTIARVRSSHVTLEKEGSVATLSVPVHKWTNFSISFDAPPNSSPIPKHIPKVS